jgi:hypothetical protein
MGCPPAPRDAAVKKLQRSIFVISGVASHGLAIGGGYFSRRGVGWLRYQGVYFRQASGEGPQKPMAMIWTKIIGTALDWQSSDPRRAVACRRSAPQGIDNLR